MTCAACAEAHTNPSTGRVNTACHDCSARAIARSPQFHATLLAKRRTSAYNDLLEAVFGVDEADQRRGHEAVLAWHNLIRTAKKESAR